MAETFEEKYEQVLQNIEFALVQVYHAHSDLTDWDATEGLRGLTRMYQAELNKQATPTLKLSPLQQEAYNAVERICEWRLGREVLMDEKGQNVAPELQFQTLDEIILCLKRILRSIQKWNRNGGRRGYFDFVSEYVK